MADTAMIARIVLLAILAVGTLPAGAQCCPDQPQSAKKQLLWQKLQEQIRAVDQQLDGVLAVAVKDLTSQEQFFINGDEIMPQASSIKIAVLATLYLQAQQGKLKLTDEFFKILSTHKESSLLQGLPDDAVAASKPGELEAVRNDSGIVFVKNRPYILCVMTAYLKDEKEGSAAIRKISALAYSYFDRIGRSSEYGRVVSPK